jgi:hypothetical protein
VLNRVVASFALRSVWLGKRSDFAHSWQLRDSGMPDEEQNHT